MPDDLSGAETTVQIFHEKERNFWAYTTTIWGARSHIDIYRAEFDTWRYNVTFVRTENGCPWLRGNILIVGGKDPDLGGWGANDPCSEPTEHPGTWSSAISWEAEHLTLITNSQGNGQKIQNVGASWLLLDTQEVN